MRKIINPSFFDLTNFPFSFSYDAMMLEKYEEELLEIQVKIKEMREKRLAKTYYFYKRWKKFVKTKNKTMKGKDKKKKK